MAVRAGRTLHPLILTGRRPIREIDIGIDDVGSKTMEIGCAGCECVVERGVRVVVCADDHCCCSELPIAETRTSDRAPLERLTYLPRRATHQRMAQESP